VAGAAVPVWIFTNNPVTTVASNGYNGGAATGDAPSAGTSETWTMSSSASFPAASSSATPPAQFPIADAAAPSEIIWVTNVSGTTWTLTRGAESTAPVTHAAGATFYLAVTSAVLAALNPGAAMFFGNVSAPAWPLYGAWLSAASGSLKSVNADGLTYELGEQRVMGTAVTTTGTTIANIPGLAAALGAGSYFIELWIPFVAGTSLFKWNFGFSASTPPTLTAVDLSGFIQGSTAVPSATSPIASFANVTSTTLSSTMWTSPESNGTSIEGLVHIWGTITVSVAGTLQATVVNNTTGDNCTVTAGSLMKISPNN
jgi:hypothetical protein